MLALLTASNMGASVVSQVKQWMEQEEKRAQNAAAAAKASSAAPGGNDQSGGAAQRGGAKKGGRNHRKKQRWIERKGEKGDKGGARWIYLCSAPTSSVTTESNKLTNQSSQQRVNKLTRQLVFYCLVCQPLHKRLGCQRPFAPFSRRQRNVVDLSNALGNSILGTRNDGPELLLRPSKEQKETS